MYKTNKNNKFAKLFDLEDGQVVVMKKWDSEDEGYKIDIVASFDDGIVTFTFSYDDEKSMSNAFGHYDNDKAINLLKTLLDR
jgi:hypothetical protein